MTSTVLITGASSGIGLATLRRFASSGWTVTAAVRSEGRAEELREVLTDEGLSARFVNFDLRDRTAMDAATAQLVEEGIPDVIVNNAGVATFGPVELSDDPSIDLALETNLVAPLRLIRAFLPHFRSRESGAIVNVSSALGFAADVGQGVYSATKHALEALSEALYYEMRPFNVRVAVVEPGLTATGIRDKASVTPGYGPDSPYWDVISGRVGHLSSTIWKDGWAESPDVVAEAIYRAATDAGTPLFIPVGRDTELSARVRGRDTLHSYEARSSAALAAWAAA